MKMLFKFGVISAILLSVLFNTCVLAESVAPSDNAANQTVSVKSAYIVASLDDRNVTRCHMVEETPLCDGMAPQKSQTADNAIRNSLSSSAVKTSETSRTFINQD